MKKFKKLSIEYQAILVYFLSLAVSFLLYPLFYNIYIFKPVTIIGGLYAVYPGWFEKFFGVSMFAYFLCLPLFVFLFIGNKQKFIWLIGIIIPSFIFLLNGTKHIFWAFVLSVIGWGLAKGILIINKMFRK